jgi:hypothetical protein
MNLILNTMLAVGPLICPSTYALEMEIRAEDRFAIEGAFQAGRVSAASAVRGWQPCSSRSAEPSIVAWLQRYQNQLVQDIEYSQHVWLTDVQPNCAFTQAQPLSPIYLSYSTCRDQVATDIAAGHLLRKSIQHYGEIDSTRIDRIVSEIYAGQFSCPPIGDRFDTSYCPGQALTAKDVVAKMRPGETRVDLKGINPELFMRSRACNRLTGCAGWVETDLLRINYSGASGTLLAGDFFRNGVLSLRLHSTTPSILGLLEFSDFNISTYGLFSGRVDSEDSRRHYFMKSNLGAKYFVEMFQASRTTDGKLSNSCFYMNQKWSTSDDAVGSRVE